MPVLSKLERLSDIAAVVGAALMVPLVVAMVYEVLSRHLFGAPTIWAFELSYMMMSGIFSLGFAYALKYRQHVNVDFIYGSLRPRWRAVVDLVGYAIFLPCAVAVSSGMFQYALRAYRSGEVSGVSSWNPVVWPLRAVLFTGFAILSLQALVEVIRCVRTLVTGEAQDTENAEAGLI